LIVCGMALVIAAAGARLAGQRFATMSGRQAECVAALEGSAECIPGGRAEARAGAARRAPFTGTLEGSPDTGAIAANDSASAPAWTPQLLHAAFGSARAVGGSLLEYAGGGTGVLAKRAPAAVLEPQPEGICFEVSGGRAIEVSGPVAGRSTSIKVSEGAVVVGADGRTMVTFTVTLSASDAGKLSRQLGGYGFEISASHGGYVTVSLTVPVVDGMACVRSLIDPTSWAPGTSLRVEIGNTTGYGGNVTVRGVLVGTRHTESAGVALVITRTDEDHLLVAVGDTETIGNSWTIGVKVGKLQVGQTAGDSLTVDELTVAEVNLDDGSVRHGTMTVVKSGNTVTGFVQLEAGVTIRYEWTINAESTTLTTTRFDGDVTETLSETTEHGAAQYTVENGVPGDVAAWWLVEAEVAQMFPGAPPCLVDGQKYVVRWTLTPADRAAFEQQVAEWWRQADEGESYDMATRLALNPIAHLVPMYEGVDAPFDAESLTRNLAGPRAPDVATLQRAWLDAGLAFPGTVEFLDPNTGLPVTCGA
jgi:hypothetical protein